MLYLDTRVAYKKKEKVNKMPPIKVVWIVAVVVVVMSMVWFSLSTSAGFQRGADLITTGFYAVFWTPGLIFVIWSIIMLKRGWMPKTINLQVVLIIVVIIVVAYVSINLFRIVHEVGYTKAWLTERVDSDYIQVTSDGKYEYRLDIINAFQNNSSARLYIKDMYTNKEMLIPIDINTREIKTLLGPKGTGEIKPPVSTWIWSEMRPSGEPMIYILTTTEHLKATVETFEIDIDLQISREIS